MNCKALKTRIRRRSLSKMLLYFFLFIVLNVVGIAFAKNSGNASTTMIPKPFFFTENKGQWDERVLYKCDAGGGLIWFLERDGFTLLATAVDKTLPLASGGTQGGVRDPMDRDLPEMLRRHPPRYPLKGHALKFKFVKEDAPPLLPPNGVRGDKLSLSQGGGRGGVYFPAQAKYMEGKSNISQPFSNNVQDIPPLLPPNGIRGDNLSPSQAGGRGGVYLPESAKYFDGKSHISQPFSNNVHDAPPFLPPNGVRGDNLSPSQAGGRGGVYLPSSAKYFEGLGELPWKNNYFLGNDSSKWAPNCRNFTSILFKDVWEGIDIEWYESNGKLEFDFIVQPGANPEQIRIAVEGLDGALSLSSAGGGTQGGVDIAIGQKESLPPLVPPARQGGKAKNDGGIDSTPLPADSRTVGELNNPHEPPQPKGTEGDNSTPPKSPKPVSRTADKWGENTPIKSPLVNGGDRISNPTTILKGENNPPAVRGGFRGGQAVGDEFILPTSLGELRTVLPKVYQIDGSGHIIDLPAKFQLIGNNDKRIHPPIAPPFTGGKANVPMADENHTGSNTDKSFEINNTKTTNIFGVVLPEGYDPAHPLRIDPLIYSTFLGGSGDDRPSCVLKSESETSIVGSTASLNFPITPGVGQPVNLGGNDCFVTKLNQNGNQILFSTFLGGISDDYTTSSLLDNDGSYIITGDTYSNNFPTTIGAYSRVYHSGGMPPSDCFVTKLNSSGSQLIFSTYFGGNGYDGSKQIVKDQNANFILIGATSAANFPVSLNAYQTTFNGGGSENSDCFLTILNSIGSQLIYSTFLGGSTGHEKATSIVHWNLSKYLIAGYTSSNDFPTTQNSFDTSYNGGAFSGDGFALCFDFNSSEIIFGTYLGGAGIDHISSMTLTNEMSISVTGLTSSEDFPLTINALDTIYSGGFEGFVTSMDSTLSNLLFSSFLGGDGSDVGNFIVFDYDKLCISGSTTSTNFPVSSSAFQSSLSGIRNTFLTMIDGSDYQLEYSTYLGGGGVDYNSGLIANSDNISIIGFTTSVDFPMHLSIDSTHNGSFDCFLTTFSFDTTNIVSELEVIPLNYSLSNSYPNPFNNVTKIRYTLRMASPVKLVLFNSLGSEVKTLINEKQVAGSYQIFFHGYDLPSGTYFYQLKCGDFTETKKMVLLR